MWPTFFITGVATLDGTDPGDFGPMSGCYTPTITYTPATHTPNAVAGDFAVVVLVRDNETPSSGEGISLPSGWRWALWCSSNSNEYRVYGGAKIAVAYKFLDSGDLAGSASFVHAAGGESTTADLCGRVYTFGNVHANVPLDNFDFQHANSIINTTSTVMRGLVTQGHGYCNVASGARMTIFTYPGTAEGGLWAGSVERLDWDSIAYDTWYTALGSNGLGTFEGIHVSMREYDAAQFAALTNLFANEAEDSIMTDWSYFGTNVPEKGLTILGTPENPYARFVSNGNPGRHYAYYQVSLVAGQKVSFHAATFHDSSTIRYVGVSVVPPSGSAGEFGFVTSGGQNPYVDEAAGGINDPDLGHEVWWWGGATYAAEDGTPSNTVCPQSLYFEAQETGTHEFRLSIGDNDAWADLEHESTTEIRVKSVALFAGSQYVGASWVPSTKSGAWSKTLPPYPLMADGVSTNWLSIGAGTGFFSFNINVTTDALPAARLVPYVNPTFSYVQLSADGLSYAGEAFAVSDDLNSTLICTRTVYPEIDGVRQKYYVELTPTLIASAGANGITLGCAAWHGRIPDKTNPLGPAGVHAWRIDGLFTSSNNTAPSSSAWGATEDTTKIGMCLNYVDGTVDWYKDGTLIASTTMYGSEDDLPFVLFVLPGLYYSTRTEFDINLAGPFSYTPSGAVAWDCIAS